jgi:hexosaminidase
MSPTAWCYFDFYQSSNRVAEPKAAAWGGPLTLSKLYHFDPMPTNVPPHFQAHILGAQGNLWTEQIPNLRQAQYMTFPRACALAEVTWSSRRSCDWADFTRRLQLHAQRLEQLGIHYRRASVEDPGAE